MLCQISGGKLKTIKAKPFTLEKELQRLVEENLGELFGLKFLATEFPIDRFRFDTVAYDGENDAFIIIEYKRGRNESLVDQGYAYLNTVLDRKAELVLLYNEVSGAAKLMKDFDWAATRVYFVSPAFTDYQKRATGYQKMPFRLFEVNPLCKRRRHGGGDQREETRRRSRRSRAERGGENGEPSGRRLYRGGSSRPHGRCPA